ncbi:type II secretion system protein [Rugamonas sp. FT82W]|uniref:Type II secretion system protein n=1 Tax=Duganella vulcania TaxID=2692166 RepID=A0A845G9X3_9BURK|nr:type II secretion system protein [Duganella vulcania]MYM90390.1 type II secretion system protein [Duganella vulcania]
MHSLRHSGGFTYLALLFFVAIAGAISAAVGVVWSTESERNKEQQLLYVGKQYRLAIQSYYEQTPGTVKRYPPNFNELLTDSRQAGTVHHLRRLLRDPMSNTLDWGMLRAPDGGIRGVCSLSTKTAIKNAKSLSRLAENFQGPTYADWCFIYVPHRTNNLSQ